MPHRLTEEEHKAFARAKQQGYLVTKGRQRRIDRGGGVGHPLLNIYRLYCDAKNMAVVCIEQGSPQLRLDTVMVDFSPLRLPSDGELRRICREIAQDTAQAAAIEESPGEPVEGLILDEADAESGQTAPIWSLPEAALRFECIERVDAKALARELRQQLRPLGLVQQLPREYKRV